MHKDGACPCAVSVRSSVSQTVCLAVCHIRRPILCQSEFTYESTAKIILKIGLHLPKLLTNVKWLTF